jgi:hypothetical protein
VHAQSSTHYRTYLEGVLVGAVISDVYWENIATPGIAFKEQKASKQIRY